MKVEKFEDLEIWREARELFKLIFEITSNEPLKRDFKFRDQIRASAGSIVDNIAEGFDRGGNKEFVQFLSISKGSCAETRSQCYRAFDVNYITEEELHDLLERTDKISRKIGSFIHHLKTSSFKGPKFQ